MQRVVYHRIDSIHSIYMYNLNYVKYIQSSSSDPDNSALSYSLYENQINIKAKVEAPAKTKNTFPSPFEPCFNHC